ncbi:chemotaxis protein CheD [Pararhodobacter marinus]|uniref:chemotaxis protein CheD n=1 Tax=Pararhodobacter marinus TaxID=2184063 RepID=UPI00351966B8
MKQQFQNWPEGYRTRTVPVIRGEYLVSSDPELVLSTVLGSCVSVCLYDPACRIGGMNHYLLADAREGEATSLKYGANAMELLINHLLKSGASRSTLQAKVFGGSRMSGRFGDIGPKNAEFALRYLRAEDFPVRAQDLGGTDARRINFHPVTGKVRIIHVSGAMDAAIVAPPPPPPPPRSAKPDAVTLF